jgi:hypothetical protein
MERALESLIWQRANGRCEYCQVSPADLDLPFEVDHVIAEHHQGRTEAGNLCLACFACNRHKGPNIAGVDPGTKRIVPLFNPRRQLWSRHFRWDGPVLVGRTSAGRATIVALKIKLEHRLDLRQGLIDEGVFPPE